MVLWSVIFFLETIGRYNYECVLCGVHHCIQKASEIVNGHRHYTIPSAGTDKIQSYHDSSEGSEGGSPNPKR